MRDTSDFRPSENQATASSEMGKFWGHFIVGAIGSKKLCGKIGANGEGWLALLSSLACLVYFLSLATLLLTLLRWVSEDEPAGIPDPISSCLLPAEAPDFF